MAKQKGWLKGEQFEYTGTSEIMHGARFFQILILTGHEKGQTKATSRCPDCGLQFGQDKRLPCFTCTTSPPRSCTDKIGIVVNTKPHKGKFQANEDLPGSY